MTEEYGSTGLVRKTEAPERATKGSNPKKARYTGLSIASLRENIARGRIDAKIEKYNIEFEKLKELASEVNQKRQDADEKTGEEKVDAYSDVMSGIEKYNAQAKKLAKLGVQILAFDEDVQKITLASESSVKAIRVPGFLIGPLKMLTKAGREKARLEKEARLEKQALEEKMYDAIVNTAQEAIGQDVEDDINVGKFASLETVADAKEVALNAIGEETTVTPPSSDIEENIEDKVEKVVINNEIFKQAKEKWEKGSHDMFSEIINSRLQEVNVAESEFVALEKLGRYTNSDRFYVTKTGDDLLLGYTHTNQKSELIDMHTFAEALGVEDKEEQIRLFNSFTDLCLMRDAWEKAASKGEMNPAISEKREVVVAERNPLPGALHGEEGVYDADRKVVFDYVIASVREGKSKEDVLANMPEGFSEEERKVVETFTNNFDVLTKGVEALDTFVVTKTATYTEEVVEKEENDMFAFLKKNYKDFGVGKGMLKGKEIDVLYAKTEEGKPSEVINPVRLAEILNLNSEMSREDLLNLYSAFTKTVKFAQVWSEIAKKRVDETIYEGSLENEYLESAFDFDRKPVFEFVVDSVRSGMTAEEIIAKAKATETFNDIHIEIVSEVVNNHYDFVKEAVAIYYGDEPITKEENDLAAMEKAAVKEVIAELVEKKYGKPKIQVTEEEPVVEENQTEKAVDEEEAEKKVGEEVGTTDTITHEDTVEDDKVVVNYEEEQPALSDDSYVSKIGRLVSEISELAKHRDRLEEALGAEEAQKQLDAINNLINAKLAEIDELTNNNVVSLGKRADEEVVETVLGDEEKLEDAPDVEDSRVEEAVVADGEDLGASVEEEASVEKVMAEEDFDKLVNENTDKEIASGVEESRVEESVVRDEEDLSASVEKVTDEEKFDKLVNENVAKEVAPEKEVVEEEDPYTRLVNGGLSPEEEAEIANRGILTDAEKDNVIAWWTEMAPILDDPDQALLSRLEIAKKEKERAAEAAEIAVEERNFEENRQAAIEADKERRAAREADPERQARRARAILAANGLEGTDISFLDEVKQLNPELYSNLYERYLDVKRAELKELSASLANENSSGAAKK